MMYYAAIDKNVLVSALLTKDEDSATAKVIYAISSGLIVPLYNEDIFSEYDEVLHRKKFPFSEERIQGILRVVEQFGIMVDPEPTGEKLIDPDDLVFYEVVMEKREDGAYLVTENQRHFPKREYIVTPAEMIAIIEPSN